MEGGVEVDAGVSGAEPQGGQAGGAGPGERVEHHSAGWAAGGDAPGREIDREGGEVRRAQRPGGDRPDVPGVFPPPVGSVVVTAGRPHRRAGRGGEGGGVGVLAAVDGVTAAAGGAADVGVAALASADDDALLERVGAGQRNPDRVEIEPVAAGPDEQEHQLVRAGHPVGDGLGHAVGLVPDDRVAQDPAVFLQGERDPPGHPDQVLESDRFPWSALRLARLAGIGGVVAVAVGRVGVTEVQPHRPGRHEHPGELGEDSAQVPDVAGCGGLQAVLPVGPHRPAPPTDRGITAAVGGRTRVGRRRVKGLADVAAAAGRVRTGRVAAGPGAGAVVAQPPVRR